VSTGRIVRASVVLVLPMAYLSYVFRLFHQEPWTSGLGDWMDPYFINALLEHWFQSTVRLNDPSSLPMYYPARRTLGYSHGLVLYAPWYLLFRFLLHPFQSYTLTLLAVMETGIVCLYVLLRRYFRLTFIEAALLGALFLTSRNVINGATSVWSQRASVFLIPPILMVLLESSRMRDGRAKLALAGLAGASASLLFTQDFYTAQFALLFTVLFLAARMLVEARQPLMERVAGFWRAQRTYSRKTVLVATALAAAWTSYLMTSGGATLSIFGVVITSRDWRRPALVALAGLMALVWSARGFRPRTWLSTNPWRGAVTAGVAVGGLAFLWIYLPAFLEHRAFPEEQLVRSLVPRDPGRWRGPLDVIGDLGAYDTHRSFAMVFVAGMLALMPWLTIERQARMYTWWLVLVSLVVLLVPLRFDGFSLWRLVFERLPGFHVIRDPKRIIYLYELAVVLGIALIVSRVPMRSVYRIGLAATVLLCLAADRNREVFEYARPNQTYDRWVGAPIEIHPSCSSFFIRHASPEYSSRSSHKWTLYNVDALFIALTHSVSTVPSLNGYSAWAPDGWNLLNPEEEVYAERVKLWIERHGLTGVCELDIDARTMTVRIP
jgi:hypothetical protein